MYLPSSGMEIYVMTNGPCPRVFRWQKSRRILEHSEPYIHHPIVVLPKVLPQKASDYRIYLLLGSLGYRHNETGFLSWMYLGHTTQSIYILSRSVSFWKQSLFAFFARLLIFYLLSFILDFFSFFSFFRSAVNCITSVLNQGGNLGCLTRLYFSGACILTTLRYTLYHIDKASSESV